MPLRFRHCIECPKCNTRYVVGSSPYDNGSYVLPLIAGDIDDWVLYCACQTPRIRRQCHWSEMKMCAVSKSAANRGYGSAEEMMYRRQRSFLEQQP
jgi:hypothetical protein